MSKQLSPASSLGQVENDPWTVEEEDFPAAGTDLEKLEFLLNYAVLAPSSRNAQPWIWQEDGGGIRLYADTCRGLGATDKNGREMIIGCGAALRFLRVAIRHFGYEGRIERFPEGAAGPYLARVELGCVKVPSQTDDALFHATCRRHTNRGIFKPDPLPRDLVPQLLQEAAAAEVWLKLVTSREKREKLIDVIAMGDMEQWADGPFKREMADWLRPEGSQASDGMPIRGQGYGEMERRLLPTAMRHPAVSRLVHLENLQADRNWVLAGGAPVLAVLGAHNTQDSPRDWLAVGEAIGGILLHCRAYGVAASFFNSPAHVHRLWTRVFKIIEHQGFIHLIFRLGYPTEESIPSPRRPVAEVLVPAGTVREPARPA